MIKTRFFIIVLVFTFSILGYKWVNNKSNHQTCTTSDYFKQNKERSSVIVFVHGFSGNGTDTWTNEDNNISWQKLIEKDKEFEKFSIYNVNYPTEFLELSDKTLNINELGTYLEDTFEAANIFEFKNVHIITHSLGGLVTKDMLLKLNINEKNKLTHIKSVAFLGVPARGSSLITLSKILPQVILSKNLKDLGPIDSNSYLDSLNDRWKKFVQSNSMRLNAWYEIQATKGAILVSKSEADAAYDTISPLNKNHITICKPGSRQDEIYKRVMHKIKSKNYSSNNITKIFHIPKIKISDTNNTNIKNIIKKQHIELINYSKENIFINYINLSSGTCFKQNDKNITHHIWMREPREITKTIKADSNSITSPYVKIKLEPNEPLSLDVDFIRKIKITDEHLHIIRNIELPSSINPDLIKNDKTLKLIEDQLMPYTINIGSTTDYIDCINLGNI